MNILLATFDLPRPNATSGSLVFMHGEVEALRPFHALSLVTFTLVGQEERRELARLRASGLSVHVIGEALPRTVIRLKRWAQARMAQLRGWPPLGNPKIADPRLPRLLDRLVREQRFDILQVENIGLGSFEFESPIPTVLIEHEVLPAAGRDGRDGRDYQPALWRRFDRVVVFSRQDAAAIHELAPDVTPRVRVNPFGIALPAVGTAEVERGSILFVGGFKHPPNVDAALWLGTEIMPLLRTMGADAHLWIVGDQPPDAVARLAGPDVTVTGRVPEVESYIDRAAVVVAPMRTGGGMRVKVLQALARGKAVVATSLGAEGLDAGADARPVLVADTAMDFAHAVSGLLADPAAAAAMGRAARAFVADHHDWARYRERLEAIYAELVAAPGAGRARGRES